MAKIGFIGLGSMGWPMATRLVQAGHAVVVFDISHPRSQAFATEAGGAVAPSLGELAATSEIVLTMLPDSQAVETVLGGSSGVLSGIRKGALIIDMSSGTPARTLQISVDVARAGGSMIDAPVSGGVERARLGKLTIMVGGADADLVRAQPVLAGLGDSIVETGGIGSAHAMKALNNLASAAGFLIGVEALLIGKKFGLDPSTMVDILNASTGMNNSTQKKLKQFVLSRDFNAGFGLDLMVKDLSIAIDIARQTSTSAPFASFCREHWASAATLLGTGRDHTELARFCEQIAGIELN